MRCGCGYCVKYVRSLCEGVFSFRRWKLPRTDNAVPSSSIYGFANWKMLTRVVGRDLVGEMRLSPMARRGWTLSFASNLFVSVCNVRSRTSELQLAPVFLLSDWVLRNLASFSLFQFIAPLKISAQWLCETVKKVFSQADEFGNFSFVWIIEMIEWHTIIYKWIPVHHVQCARSIQVWFSRFESTRRQWFHTLILSRHGKRSIFSFLWKN